jgi:hypothetical protein
MNVTKIQPRESQAEVEGIQSEGIGAIHEQR